MPARQPIRQDLACQLPVLPFRDAQLFEEGGLIQDARKKLPPIQHQIPDADDFHRLAQPAEDPIHGEAKLPGWFPLHVLGELALGIQDQQGHLRVAGVGQEDHLGQHGFSRPRFPEDPQMIGFAGTVRAAIEVLEPEGKPGRGAVDPPQVEELSPVGGQQILQDGIIHQMDRRAGRGDGAQDAGAISRAIAAEDGADDHLTLMRVLAFAHRIHPAALADEAAHRGVLMPDVPQPHLGDLTQGVVRFAVLLEPEEGELAHQFPVHRAGQDVQGELRGGRWRAHHADAFRLIDLLIQGMRRHFPPPPGKAVTGRSPCDSRAGSGRSHRSPPPRFPPAAG
ncbi:hypothetical protein HRbin22_01959 [Candidatus Thermoflexus japonica]|uniref:Uncharacterized protein n=1 Tax=Candidatus Thermoflexus japonica TaxID=2035417 RepID=A0A2H5Y8D6_9CHLR|nr:hypothetical protein HRbin22_01959 [Candidatus Thermoflexus japonica]